MDILLERNLDAYVDNAMLFDAAERVDLPCFQSHRERCERPQVSPSVFVQASRNSQAEVLEFLLHQDLHVTPPDDRFRNALELELSSAKPIINILFARTRVVCLSEHLSSAVRS